MKGIAVLIIDNFDSFTLNLRHLFETLGAECTVVRNTEACQVNVDSFSHVVIGPGPGMPVDLLILEDLIGRLYNKPLLGVCLGMQYMLYREGNKILNLTPVRHGAHERITINDGTQLFKNLQKHLFMGLYHSWGAKGLKRGSEYRITSQDGNKVIMSVKHRKRPWFGVQFHPESIMSEGGETILKNFLDARGKTNNSLPPLN